MEQVRTAERSRGRGRESVGRQDWARWPNYEAAVLGFRDYWYPVDWSRKIGTRARRLKLVGEDLMLGRTDEGLVCRTRDGKRSYPAQDRVGLVWIFVGDGDPPPLEADLPSEVVDPNAVVLGRITTRTGNWRFGAENGFDDGHAKYLHRKSLWVWRRQMPTWTRIHVEPTGEGWITRIGEAVHFETDFPGLGQWPRSYPRWKRRGKGGAQTSIRLPAMLRVAYADWAHFEWWIGVEPDKHIYVQLAVKKATGWDALRFRLFYRLWARWVFHGLFNDEDRLMVDVMDAPPERLYRPDVSITEWRLLCERQARGAPVTATEASPSQAAAA
jgi:phenylpropionate dioxygenase-like ring-hydroxylating dioxygenase large terminal subunit